MDVESLLKEMKRHINLSPTQELLLEEALRVAVNLGAAIVDDIMRAVRSREDGDAG